MDEMRMASVGDEEEEAVEWGRRPQVQVLCERKEVDNDEDEEQDQNHTMSFQTMSPSFDASATTPMLKASSRAYLCLATSLAKLT